MDAVAVEQFLAAYTRKSRALDKHISPEDLFRNHKPAMERKAKEAGLVLPGDRIFMEKSSGESIAEREVFRGLLAEIDRLPIKAGGVLIVVSQDRLSRGDMAEQMDLLRRLRRAGVRVLSVTEGWIDLDNLNQRKMAELRSWVANLYIEEYKVKQGLAYDALRRRGEVRQGRVPYG